MISQYWFGASNHYPSQCWLRPMSPYSIRLQCNNKVDVFILHVDDMAWHDDVMEWKHFPRYWPFVRGIHRSRWIPRIKTSEAELLFIFFIFVWINSWVNNREAGDLRHHGAHYDDTAWKHFLRYCPFVKGLVMRAELLCVFFVINLNKLLNESSSFDLRPWRLHGVTVMWKEVSRNTGNLWEKVVALQ